ncbi:hypothetical protein D9M71_786800 [compost metagenome]
MPKPRRINCSLATRLPWLTCTPLGNDVEPEVYCKKAMSSGARSGICQWPARLLSRLSTHSSRGAPGADSASMASNGSRKATLVSTSCGSASAMIDSRRSW